MLELKDLANNPIKGTVLEKIIRPALVQESMFIGTGFLTTDFGAQVFRFRASPISLGVKYTKESLADEIKGVLHEVIIDTYRKFSNTFSMFDMAQLGNPESQTFQNTIGTQSQMLGHEIDILALKKLDTHIKANKATLSKVLTNNTDDKLMTADGGKELYGKLLKQIIELKRYCNQLVVDGVNNEDLVCFASPEAIASINRFYAETGREELYLQKGTDKGFTINGIEIVEMKKLNKNSPINTYSKDLTVNLSKYHTIIIHKAVLQIVLNRNEFGVVPNSTNLNKNYILEASLGLGIWPEYDKLCRVLVSSTL